MRCGTTKGGVGKSYLTFQIACEYARTHPQYNVLVLDLCPQANASSMLLGGVEKGERNLEKIVVSHPRRTIAGYINGRVLSPYVNPHIGAEYLLQVQQYNSAIPENLFLVSGDEDLELQASRVVKACSPGPDDAWRIVHGWISDLIADIRLSWNVRDTTIFVDCNLSFTIYTELALSASDRLLIPFSADGSSKRAVCAVLSLLYGRTRSPGALKLEFYLQSERFRLSVPRIYCYVGNRLTQMNNSSASAFKTVVGEIGQEIFEAWSANPGFFCIHPGHASPSNRTDFRKMFQVEIHDANTASVVSSALGIPISVLTAGKKKLSGKTVTVNQTQLDRQKPNLQEFVRTIE